MEEKDEELRIQMEQQQKEQREENKRSFEIIQKCLDQNNEMMRLFIEKFK